MRTSGWYTCSMAVCVALSAACSGTDGEVMQPSVAAPPPAVDIPPSTDPSVKNDAAVPDVARPPNLDHRADTDAGTDGGAPERSTPRIGRPSLGRTPLPCALREVVQVSCQGCHGRSPRFQAPMALTSVEDFLAAAVSDPSKKVWELARVRIHDSERPMPPLASRRLTAEELATLTRELTEELRTGPESCNGDPPDLDLPEVAQEDIDQCYRLQAHALPEAGDRTPFRVAPGESHACFFFEPPWPADAQAVTIRSIDSPLVHHWLLSDTTQSFTAGEFVTDVPHCNFDASKVYAVYAVNQQEELRMPKDVGLELPAPGKGIGLLLGLHYYNTGEPTDDLSGVEICTAKSKRPIAASIVQLGPAFFALPAHRENAATGSCRSRYQGDITLIRSFPHMHELGISLNTIIERSDGTRETYIDKPFDFNNQIVYDVNATIRHGDRLVTTCNWKNTTDRTVYIGESTDEEMCINFVTYYPANSLVTGYALSGAEQCSD